jgi:sugar lactone lactonase YvrE
MSRCAVCSVVVVLLGWVVAAAHAADQPAPPVLWERGEGISAPESVYYHAGSGSLFVSNIGQGGPTGKDGDGYISKLNTAGNVVKLKWATGLDAPKGMRASGDTLWVSDVDRLVGIDLKSGAVRTKVDVPGATFLNDVACGPDGAVYVSDTLRSRILRYADGKVALFAEGEELECPNGLLVEGDRLIVAAWGKDPAEDFSTEVPGTLLSLDLKTKQRKAITDGPVGNLDGLEADGRGGWYVTDWVAGKVLHVSEDGTVRPVAQLGKGAADLAYLPDKKAVIVPRMLENKVTALDVSK